MKLDSQRRPSVSVTHQDESDDENCALSENWAFEPQIRRWSRVGEMGPMSLQINTAALAAAAAASSVTDNSSVDSRESSPERGVLSAIELLGFATLPLGLAAHPSTEPEIVDKLKRTGSERFKDGARALLKKVESSTKVRKRRGPHSQAAPAIVAPKTLGVVIREPAQLNLIEFNQRLQNSNRKHMDIKMSRSNPSSPLPTSPLHTPMKSFLDFANASASSSSSSKIPPGMSKHATVYITSTVYQKIYFHDL